MTRKEAIAVLECLALEMNAILAGIPKSEATADQIKRCIDAYDMSISALRQQDVTDKYVGKMTNAQKIRAMNDEELAEFLDENAEYCHVGLCKDGETCRICCLRWLQMTAEEDKHENLD